MCLKNKRFMFLLVCLNYTVGDWAEALLGLGELCPLLNLTDKSDIHKGELAATVSLGTMRVSNLDLKASTIGHHLANKCGLTAKLTYVDFHFVV